MGGMASQWMNYESSFLQAPILLSRMRRIAAKNVDMRRLALNNDPTESFDGNADIVCAAQRQNAIEHDAALQPVRDVLVNVKGTLSGQRPAEWFERAFPVLSAQINRDLSICESPETLDHLNQACHHLDVLREGLFERPFESPPQTADQAIKNAKYLEVIRNAAKVLRHVYYEKLVAARDIAGLPRINLWSLLSEELELQNALENIRAIRIPLFNAFAVENAPLPLLRELEEMFRPRPATKMLRKMQQLHKRIYSDLATRRAA
jgi:hypothetical protein